jgi:hypothetical protein
VSAITWNFSPHNPACAAAGSAAVSSLLYAVSGAGAVANVGIAAYVFHTNRSWWLAGVAGALISTVWNYDGGLRRHFYDIAKGGAAPLAEEALAGIAALGNIRR